MFDVSHRCSTPHASAAVNRDTRGMKSLWRDTEGATGQKVAGGVTRLLLHPRPTVYLNDLNANALRRLNSPRRLRYTSRISTIGAAVRNIWQVNARGESYRTPASVPRRQNGQSQPVPWGRGPLRDLDYAFLWRPTHTRPCACGWERPSAWATHGQASESGRSESQQSGRSKVSGLAGNSQILLAYGTFYVAGLDSIDSLAKRVRPWD